MAADFCVFGRNMTHAYCSILTWSDRKNIEKALMLILAFQSKTVRNWQFLEKLIEDIIETNEREYDIV